MTAISSDGQSSRSSITYTVVGLPLNTVMPQVSGTDTVGSTLSCSQGGWTGTPTSFAYAWSRDGTPLKGFAAATYTVQTLDEGSTLRCTVTATNIAGSAAATSAGLAIAVPKVKLCPAASGGVSGDRLGLIKLGMTQAQAHHAYRRSSKRGKPYEDFFCLTPIGIRVGYASPTLLKHLSAAQQRTYRGHVVWASSANPRYGIDGIRAGATLAAAKQQLPNGTLLTIGLNDWYLAPAGNATAVFKVRQGIIEEIGIAVSALTKTKSLQRTFMGSFD